MKPINLGGHTAYQDQVLTLMRKYYPDPDPIPSSTWTIIDHFWHLDLSRVDEQMANRYGCDIKKHRLKFRCPLVSRKYGCSCDNPCSDSPYGRTVWLQMKDDPRLINIPPRTSEEWKLEYNARTSSERCNKREKNDFLLESNKHRSSRDWYCRLYCIMMCQHLDAWDLPYESQLQSLLRQAA